MSSGGGSNSHSSWREEAAGAAVAQHQNLDDDIDDINNDDDEEEEDQHDQQSQIQIPIQNIHSTSKWAEVEREDSLTLWEVHRTPREIATVDRRITVPTKSLNSNLKCAICLGYLKEATLVMNCLHRFCNKCIHQCIRMGMKECPNCRQFIPSRRSLRRDPKFDAILEGVVGDPLERQIWESRQGQKNADKMVHLQRTINGSNLSLEERRKRAHALLSSSSTGGPSSHHNTTLANMEQLQQKRKQQRKKPRPAILLADPLIEIELRRHPIHEDDDAKDYQDTMKVDRLERPFVTIRGDAKVKLVKTFLKQKLHGKSPVDANYEITSTLDDNTPIVLGDDVTLLEAKQTLCAGKRAFNTNTNTMPMVLQYKRIAVVTANINKNLSPLKGGSTSIAVRPVVTSQQQRQH